MKVRFRGAPSDSRKEQVLALAPQFSPVYDMVSNPLPVKLELMR